MSQPQEEKDDTCEIKQKQRKALNKKEKNNVTDAVERVNPMSCTIMVCSSVKQQVPAHNNTLRELSNSLTAGDTLFLFEHLQKTFIELYKVVQQ